MNKPHKLITIRDIADRAGVSSATVSRAVNHRLKVSTETYKRITTAMEELGYVLPESPGHLAGDPNNRFVLLNIPQMGNPVFVDYVEGVSASAKNTIGMCSSAPTVLCAKRRTRYWRCCKAAIRRASSR